MKRFFFLSLCVFLTFSNFGADLTLNGLVYDRWVQESKKDKFGDPTSSYTYSQFQKGVGNGAMTPNNQIVIVLLYDPTPAEPGFNTGIGICTALLPLTVRIGLEDITLYVKDSSENVSTIKGIYGDDSNKFHRDVNMMACAFHGSENDALLSLFRRQDTYKAVIEGKDWDCSFSFKGGMPD